MSFDSTTQAEWLLNMLAFFSFVAAVAYVVFILAGLPIVEWSYSQDECVQVIPATAGSCEELPDRYEIVYVK